MDFFGMLAFFGFFGMLGTLFYRELKDIGKTLLKIERHLERIRKKDEG